MSIKRKIVVWFLTLVGVGVVYVLYNSLVDTPQIKFDQNSEAIKPIEMPPFKEGSRKIDETVIEHADNTRIVDRDPVTKQITRVWGFKELLNPEGNSPNWRVKKPYINQFENGFQYDITSEKGTIQVVMIRGNPKPSQANLENNVEIHIHSASNTSVDTMIYLDDLTYNAERMDFRTEGPIKIISQTIHLEGKGLTLIYNSIDGQPELIEISDIDFIHFKDVEGVSSSTESSTGKKPDSKKASSVQVSDSESISAAEVSDGGSTFDNSDAGQGALEQSQEELYRCTFRDHVVIRYGAEIRVYGKEKVIINNILLGKDSENQQTSSGTTVTTQPSVTTKPSVTAKPSEADKPVAGSGEPSTQTATGDKGPVDVVITCDNGMIITPMTSNYAPQGISEKELAKKIQEKSERDIEIPETGELEYGKCPTILRAKTLNYDATTGNALIEKDVELTLYITPEEADETSAESVPVEITAVNTGEYSKDLERITFNGDVVITNESQKNGYLDKNILSGENLIVDFVKSRDQSEDKNIEHLTVVGGEVKLESTRAKDDVIINHVMLKCVRVDYNAIDEIVTATGPGKIELNNENVPPPVEPSDEILNFENPCYGLVKDFDKLEWFIADNQITAYGNKYSVEMQHIPIIDGKLGPRVKAVTSHMVANFIDTDSGRAELVNLNATDGVYYSEEDGIWFTGDRLYYDARTSLVTVKDSDQIPCILNGAEVPYIKYNLKTDETETRISPSPGTIPKPKRKKRTRMIR